MKRKEPKKSRAKGKTPSEIMTRQIKEKDSVITDEEFRDLDIGTELSKETVHEPIDLPKGKDRPKDEEKDPDTATPWDILK